MLRDRIVVALLLLPVALWLIASGGLPFWALVSIFLVLGGIEYGQLFEHMGLRPSSWLVAAGILAVIAMRAWAGFDHAGILLLLITQGALLWYLIQYERGASRSGSEFAVTLGGILYVGWLGAYLVSLRALPDGTWWFLIVMPAIWIGDSLAFSIGRRFGRHRMTPRLSPRKTWEGYLGSVLGGALSGGGLALAWQIAAQPASGLRALSGLLIGGLVGALAPLGDLAISMIKREAGVKDSGNLLPGHGGALDRIDSWIVAASVGYYLVVSIAPFFR
ncbi:MAG: phosphatidate cytidylyltransferase [Anaerolineales bacterium]|jgi:phosphatidate cytidylyltransferase